MPRTTLILVVALIVPATCLACLWDYDTLTMERQQFPDAQELIAGHFVRHSDAYYEWRITDRTAKPADQQTAIDFDDIAVAYDKLGQHDKAIETIREKMARWPDERLYESEANLGTFYIHAGRLEEGLEHINKAIEINPDAHFGREIYQKLLVEYVIQQRADDATLPLNDKRATFAAGFAAYVMNARKPADDARLAEMQAAAKGMMGMMRFGQHDSPILLEALGDLLSVDGDVQASRMLAARAYLKASYEVDDAAAATAYRRKAGDVLQMQYERELSEIEADLKSEIAQGDSFFAEITADERSWMESGKNLDREFANKYYQAPPLQVNRPDWSPEPLETTVLKKLLRGATILFIAALVSVVVLVVIIRKGRRRGRNDE